MHSITHVNTDNIVMWVILQNTASWDCFKTLILQEILKIQNTLWKEHFFGSHTFVPTSWMDVLAEQDHTELEYFHYRQNVGSLSVSQEPIPNH